jgi:hypothetical protein
MRELNADRRSSTAVTYSGLWRLAVASGGAAIAVLAIPGTAAAQAPLDEGRHLDLQLTGRVQYDSNVARESKAQAALSGTRPDDIRYSAVLSVDGGMPIGRESAFLRGTVGYDVYQYNKDLKRARADLKGGVGGRLGPCVASVNAGYLRALVESAPLTNIDNRNAVENVISYGASTSCPLFGPIGGTFSVNRVEQSSSDARTLVDHNTTSASAAVGYHSRGFGDFSVVGSYSTTNYGQPPTAVPSMLQVNGTEIYSIGLQYTRPISRRLTGVVGGSLFRLRRDDSSANQALTGENTSGSAWNVGLAYHASQRLNFNLAYSDSTGATSRLGSAYQRMKLESFGVTYKFSSRMDGGISIDNSDRKFSGTASTALGEASTLRRLRYSANLGYDLGRKIRLGFDVARETVHTNVSTQDYDANRASVSVSARF